MLEGRIHHASPPVWWCGPKPPGRQQRYIRGLCAACWRVREERGSERHAHNQHDGKHLTHHVGRAPWPFSVKYFTNERVKTRIIPIIRQNYPTLSIYKFDPEAMSTKTSERVQELEFNLHQLSPSAGVAG